MNRKLELVFCIVLSLLLSCSQGDRNSETIQPDKKKKEIGFLTYTDTINVGLIVSFRYPENLVVSRIENGMCIHEKYLKSEEDIVNKAHWKLWMYSDKTESIDTLISQEVKSFPGTVNIDTIALDSKAIRLTIKTSDKGPRIRRVIYLNKYDSIFEMTTDKPSKYFQIFSHSLRIKKLQ